MKVVPFDAKPFEAAIGGLGPPRTPGTRFACFTPRLLIIEGLLRLETGTGSAEDRRAMSGSLYSCARSREFLIRQDDANVIAPR